MKIRKLIKNAIKTPDGTILESKHRHDYKDHVNKTNGIYYAVDGGLDYLKRIGDSNYIELSKWEDESN